MSCSRDETDFVWASSPSPVRFGSKALPTARTRLRGEARYTFTQSSYQHCPHHLENKKHDPHWEYLYHMNHMNNNGHRDIFIHTPFWPSSPSPVRTRYEAPPTARTRPRGEARHAFTDCPLAQGLRSEPLMRRAPHSATKHRKHTDLTVTPRSSKPWGLKGLESETQAIVQQIACGLLGTIYWCRYCRAAKRPRIGVPEENEVIHVSMFAPVHRSRKVFT